MLTMHALVPTDMREGQRLHQPFSLFASHPQFLFNSARDEKDAAL